MTYKYVNNIYFRCLLLLVVAGACASQRTGRHYYQQTDGAGTTAAVQDVPTPVVVETPVVETPEEPVRSARPLVSQVRRAAEGTRLAVPVAYLRDDAAGTLRL